MPYCTWCPTHRIFIASYHIACVTWQAFSLRICSEQSSPGCTSTSSRDTDLSSYNVKHARGGGGRVGIALVNVGACMYLTRNWPLFALLLLLPPLVLPLLLVLPLPLVLSLPPLLLMVLLLLLLLILLQPQILHLLKLPEEKRAETSATYKSKASRQPRSTARPTSKKKKKN